MLRFLLPPPLFLMRILLAIDGGEHSAKTVSYLTRHAAWFGQASLTCLFVEALPPLRSVGAFGADPGMPAMAGVDAHAITAPLLDELRQAGYTPQLEVRAGEPGPEISQAANDGAYDLLIIGATHRGLLRRKLLGSVSSAVLSACEVPLLIVH